MSAFRGAPVVVLPELESVRRLRESVGSQGMTRRKEASESPIEKGGGHKPVAQIKMLHGTPHFTLGGKMYAIQNNQVVEDPDMASYLSSQKEGGPGSGPRKGTGERTLYRKADPVKSSISKVDRARNWLSKYSGGTVGYTVYGALQNKFGISAAQAERVVDEFRKGEKGKSAGPSKERIFAHLDKIGFGTGGGAEDPQDIPKHIRQKFPQVSPGAARKLANEYFS